MTPNHRPDGVPGGGWKPPVTNDFPRLNIDTAELLDEVMRLLEEAEADKANMGAVNWADLSVQDIEYRLSMLRPKDGPYCIVTVEEASPSCELQQWLNDRLDKERFHNTWVECEW